MAKCKIVFSMGVEGPPYFAGGESVAYAQCETHAYALGRATAALPDMCPIGRIEQAVDEGLEKIACAIKAKNST